MGADQPFMYNAASSYSFVSSSDRGFNPRAATQASWTPPRPRPKVEGPLIQSRQFNRHPDSYIAAPYGNLNWKPMSPRTKVKVKWARITLLLLRVCALIGAAGLLFCVICIKGTGGVTGWIIRVPAAVAILHVTYGIYHLARPSKGRTPASCASYMLFASVLDVGLIPFYVLTGLMAKAQIQNSDAQNRWQTLFNDDSTTSRIINATFITAIVDGGIHLVSLCLSVYLAILFRQISRLPPDMNPLEDNLTSRHSKKNSSNRNSQISNVAANSKRSSKESESESSPLRSVPFMHTRNDSHANISDIPRPEFSPRTSRAALPTPYYDPPASQRSSRVNMNELSSTNSPSKRDSRTLFPNLMLQSQPPPSFPGKQQQKQSVPVGGGLHRSPTKASSIYSHNTNSTVHLGSSLQEDENWITHPSPSSSPSHSLPRELKHLVPRKNPSYQPLSQTAPFEYTANDENLPPLAPLEMNPPTPPLLELQKQRNTGKGQRALTPANNRNSRADSIGRGWGRAPSIGEYGKTNTWGSGSEKDALKSPRGGGGGKVATRVVSRSGVEVRQSGIFPSGGVRAREVSGKVVEEGRGGGDWNSRN